MDRKKLIAGIVSLLIIGGLAWLANWYFTTVNVRLTSKNAVSVRLQIDGKTIASGDIPLETRVPKNSNITVEYVGKEGYDEGSRQVDIKDEDIEFSFEPYYSKSRLSEITTEQSADISQSIISSYPSLSSKYSIEDTTSYHYGEWASAALKWRGEYEQNSDTQHVILYKDKDQWVVKDKPAIIISAAESDTPVDILRRVNNSVLN